MGLCKIVWNDIVPADNYKEEEAHKIPDHVRNYHKFFEGMTGMKLNEKKMLEQSERVYQLQRILNRFLGYGTREHDRMPYRGMGPVTEKEYESRVDRYDKQLKELVDVNPEGKSTEEKMKLLRTYREDQYNKVVDAAYDRRGWTRNGIPKVSRLKDLGIDLPQIVDVVKDRQD